MATLSVLLGAIALLLVHSALGLGIRRATPVEQSGEPPPGARLQAGAISEDEDVDEEGGLDAGPEKYPADNEQNWRFAKASQQCRLPAGAPPRLENGVVAYLVTRRVDLTNLGQSVPRLRHYFLRHWAYDVKIFIPGDALREYDRASFGHSPTHQDVLMVMRQVGGEGYSWEVVTFNVEFPKVLSDDPDWESKMNACAKAVSTSYKHMNQFFTKAMYEHPALDKYRYYLRLDADFNFMDDLVEDPFCMMAKTGRKFMWQTRKHIGDSNCSEGLFEWFKEYQLTHGLTPQDRIYFRRKGARVNYVGYVGMGDLDFFRSEPVRRLAEALNDDGRIYLSRWSDQTYYVLLFALFENHYAVGDIGFGWPESTWCHKCAIPEEPFNKTVNPYATKRLKEKREIAETASASVHRGRTSRKRKRRRRRKKTIPEKPFNPAAGLDR